MKVVANATPFIALAKIKKLSLIKELFGEIFVPKEVYDEITIKGDRRKGASEFKRAPWLKVLEVKDRTKVDILLSELDKGEAEAIVLAQEIKADLLLIDEEKARVIARFAGLRYLGTVGLLLLAKKRKLIPMVKPVLERLINTGFRLSDKVYQAVITKANESKPR